MTKLPSIKNIDVKGKRVLLRVDFNVLIKNNKVEDEYRIKRSLPTIRLLKKKGAKIILMSHLTAGRAKNLKAVARYINKYFKVGFVDSNDLRKIKAKVEKLKSGEVIFLKNIRTFKGEEENSLNFAKSLAGLGDIYVNDAFSVSHRKHASVVGITKYLPSYAGLLFLEEYKNLKGVFKTSHPFLLIIGGIKFRSKIGMIDRFLKTADKVFIGGALANTFLREGGLDVKNSVVCNDVSIKKYKGNKKIILPVDYLWSDDMILDIGPETIKDLSELVRKAKFVLWNGPLGDYEKKGFEKGTWEIAKAIAKSRARSVIGGGDSVACVAKIGILNKFSFVSTGGGAMLEFLARGTLSGIEALNKPK